MLSEVQYVYAITQVSKHEASREHFTTRRQFDGSHMLHRGFKHCEVVAALALHAKESHERHFRYMRATVCQKVLARPHSHTVRFESDTKGKTY